MISLSSFTKIYYTYILFMPFYYTNLYDIITRLKQQIHLHAEDSVLKIDCFIATEIQAVNII